MVFKLVRIDTQEPCKIQLTIGKHVIGRGKFLHNDETDKRVSRNHAELEVTSNSVCLKSLHQNPCFFMKKSIETHLLHQDTTVSLCHGDKFGLLPDHFWYEVLHCPDQDSVEERASIGESTENGIHNDEDDRMNESEGITEHDNISSNAKKGEDTINFDDSEKEVDAIRTVSPSLLKATEQATTEGKTVEQISAEPETAEPVIVNSEIVDQDMALHESPVHSPDAQEIAPQISAEPETADPVIVNSDIFDQDMALHESPVSSHDVQEIAPQISAEPETANPEIVKTEIFDQDMALHESPVPGHDVQEIAPQISAEPEIADQVTVKLETIESPAQLRRADDGRPSTKRYHSNTESSPGNNKRVKTERVYEEDGAGPSNGLQASPNTDRKDIIPMHRPPLRERCIYGANCYRRNAEHKAQYSHPADADWGPARLGRCPYGRACRRADPRHWAAHAHPPQAAPPAPPARPARPPRPGQIQNRRQRRDSVSDDDDDEEDPPVQYIIVGKRARKIVNRQSWSGTESEEENDPYGTDESEEWQPSSNVTSSQDFSQDF